MTTDTHKTTRRSLLGAMAAAPALVALPVTAPVMGAVAAMPERAAWNAAVAAYDKAKQEADVAHQRWERAGETIKEITGRVPWDKDYEPDPHVERLTGWDGLNETIDSWGDRVADAADALLKMPAPDNGALLWKLEYLFGEELDGGAGSTAAWRADFFAPTMADIRRLLSVGRA